MDEPLEFDVGVLRNTNAILVGVFILVKFVITD